MPDSDELRKLAAWYREFAERTDNPADLGCAVAHGRKAGSRRRPCRIETPFRALEGFVVITD